MKKPIQLQLEEINKIKNNIRYLLTFSKFKSLNALMKEHHLNREEAEQYLLQNYDNYRHEFNKKEEQRFNRKVTEAKLRQDKKLKKSRENKLNEIIKKRLEEIKKLPKEETLNVLIDVKTYVILKGGGNQITWKNETYEKWFNKANLEDQIENYLKSIYPREETYGFVYMKSYIPQIIEDIKTVNITDIHMKRAQPIKLPFLRWFDDIDEISYEDHDDKCVSTAIMKYWNIKKPKTINNVFKEASLKLYSKVWNEKDGVTAKMIKYLCQEKHTAMLGIDQYDNKFIKYQPETQAVGGKYRPIVFYQVTGHFYLIKSSITSITATFRDNNNLTNCNVSNDDEKENKNINYINYDDISQTEQNNDDEDQKRKQEKLKNIFEKIKQLEPNTVVLVKQGNINDLLKVYVSIYNKCPNVKYESKTNVKTICLNNNIKITTTETLLDNKIIQNICKKEELTFNNQSIGTLLIELMDKFYNSNSKRKYISNETKQKLLEQQRNKCNLCEELIKCPNDETLGDAFGTGKYHIDHIRPLANGGDNSFNNLQAICPSCHREKTMEEKQNCDYVKLNDFVSCYNIEAYKAIKSNYFKKIQWCNNLIDEEYNEECLENNFKFYSIDDNKCRRNILLNYKEDFAVYSVLDNITDFDGNITTGWYLFEIERDMLPLRKNTWYSKPMVDYCLKEKLISKFNIKYQYKPSFILPHNYFEPFVEYLLNLFADNKDAQKLSINALIGLFGVTTNEFITNAVVDKTNLDDLGAYYNKFHKPFLNDIGGDFGILTQSTKIDKLENSYPIYAQILDCEAIELHKKVKLLKQNGFIPKCVKTDAVCYYSINGKKFDVSNYYWDNNKTILKYKDEAAKNIIRPIKWTNKTKFIKQSYKWNKIIDDETIDFNVRIANDIVNLIGCFLDGMPGTGKTTTINEVIKILINKYNVSENEIIRLTPTNVSALLIEGGTIDKFKIAYLKNAKSITKLENVKYIFIDEISMMKELFYNVFISVKHQYPNINFILSGDFGQLKPVADRKYFNYKNSHALYQLVNGNICVLTRCRRSDNKLFNLYKSIRYNEDYDITELENNDWVSYKNICFTNYKRKEVNQKCLKRFIEEFKPSVTFNVKALKYDTNTQDYTLCKGMPIISRLNMKSLNVLNNEMFICDEIKKDTILISNSLKKLEIEKSKFIKMFNLAFCITTHKSQGLTIKDKYCIYEWNLMNKRLKYVSISRAKVYENINIL